MTANNTYLWGNMTILPYKDIKKPNILMLCNINNYNINIINSTYHGGPTKVFNDEQGWCQNWESFVLRNLSLNCNAKSFDDELIWKIRDRRLHIVDNNTKLGFLCGCAWNGYLIK